MKLGKQHLNLVLFFYISWIHIYLLHIQPLTPVCVSQSIWQASRWLFLLVFGLPTLIISIICYSLCCMEPLDDSYLEDEEDELQQLQQESAGDAKAPDYG